MSDPRILGWGLIGASDIADTRMIPAINAQPDARVVAVVSASGERARQLAAAHAIRNAYDTLEALLADPAVDAVYISSTNDHHLVQALAAARAGKHVLCEKPLALTLADARLMVDSCHEAGVVIGTNHHLRNAASIRTLQRLVADGVIGTPLAARVFHAVYLPPRLQGWRLTDPAAGGGVIFDITVHDADTLRFVLGSEVLEATALSATQGLASGALEDAVMGVLRLENGVLAQFHDAFTIAHARTGMELHGTAGSLYATGVMTQEPVGQIILRRDGREEQVAIEAPEDLYVRSVRLFDAAIRGDGQPSATGEDGIRSLAVALAVRESAATGRVVPVERS